MKRRLPSLVLAAGIALLGMPGIYGQAAKQVELKVRIDLDTPDNKAIRDAWFNRIKRFEAQNPGIKVTAVPFDSTDRQTAFIAIAAKTAPDIYPIGATEGQLFVSRKWVAPIDEYLKTWDKAAWYSPAAFDPFKFGGKIYGVCDNIYVKHIIYNKKMFKAKGVPEPTLNWTWKDFAAAAQKLADPAKGVAGFAPMTKNTEAGWSFCDMVFQAGGELEKTDAEGKTKAVFDSPEAIAAAQLLKDLKWKYDALPENWSLGWGDVFNEFGAERAAMVYDGDNGRSVAINGGQIDPKDIGVALMPKGPGPKGRQAGVMGGTFWVINGLTTDKAVRDAAWKWIIFERWDQGDLDAIKAEIQQARDNKQYRSRFTLRPLLPTVPYMAQERAIMKANSDAAIIWGDDAFLKALPGTGHLEPSVEAQILYGQYLAPLIQSLLSDKNADPAALMKSANARFQKDVLDPLNAKAK
jgi:multiple sugar transport system substrate-binding protein